MKNYKLILVLIITVLMGTSCGLLGEEDRTYDGDLLLEFKTPVSATVEDGSGTVDLLVQLIGEQQSEDITADLAVVDSTTTAVEGTHYNLASQSLTISSGSSSTNVAVEILDAGMAEGEEVTLEIEILDNDSQGVSGSENNDSFTFTIEGIEET